LGSGDAITEFFEVANEYLWYVGLVLLVIAGIYFGIRLKGMQITRMRKNARLALTDISEKEKGTRKLTSLEAFLLGLGSRVGVGNIAGVATAIVTGGPGSVFWMWLFALMGAGTAFIESTASQIYKEKKADGGFYGGPAYYIMKGLRNKKLAIGMALLSVVTFGFGWVGVQACNATAAITSAFDVDSIFIGALFALGVAAIVFSGTKKLARIMSKIVPVMVLAWVAFAVAIVVINYENFFNIFAMIFRYAFDAPALLGGGIGAAIMVGMQRGIFSNEAGLGSIANIAGTADTTHPAKQGFVQSFGVIVDTFVVCSFTAFTVLSFGDWESIMEIGLRGSPLVQEIASQALGGWAAATISLFLFFFAFTSLMGEYAMSEGNIRFVKDDHKVILVLRILTILTVFGASLIDMSMMDLISDTFNAAMAITNVFVLVLLSRTVLEVYHDYLDQKRRGIEEPVFHKSAISDSEGVTEWDD